VGAIIEWPPRGPQRDLPGREPTQPELLEIHRKNRRVMTIPKIVGYYRMNVAKRINDIRNSPGIPVWQRNYFEHIIRDEKSRFRINRYIRENPLNWHRDSENHLDFEQQDMFG
jgi:putative transposase